MPPELIFKNLVGIDSAIADLRTREKDIFCVDFLLTYRLLSICLSVSSSRLQASFGTILTLSGSNDVISQPLVPFGGHINTAPY